MDDQKIPKQPRIRDIAMGVSFLIAIGFFFYGLINNIAAKKEKELALRTMIQLKECEQKAEEQTKQLMKTLQETKAAQEYAFQKAKAAEELSKKSTSIK
jgi:hypothetical protein